MTDPEFAAYADNAQTPSGTAPSGGRAGRN